MADVTARSGLIDQVPGQNGGLILVHAPIDGVDTVGEGPLVVLVKPESDWAGEEVFGVLQTSSCHILQDRHTAGKPMLKLRVCHELCCHTCLS